MIKKSLSSCKFTSLPHILGLKKLCKFILVPLATDKILAAQERVYLAIAAKAVVLTI